jgi:hypothetical protein
VGAALTPKFNATDPLPARYRREGISGGIPMKKMLGICAAAALMAAFALPVPAVVAEKRADGLRSTDQVTEFSAKKRKKYRGHAHRYHRHYHGPRYGYRYRPHYYDAPYYAYAPRYYRPYYRPGVSVGVGPFGFGFGL